MLTRPDLYRHVRDNPDFGWPDDLVADARQYYHDALHDAAARREPSLAALPVRGDDEPATDWRGLIVGVTAGGAILAALGWAWGW